MNILRKIGDEKEMQRLSSLYGTNPLTILEDIARSIMCRDRILTDSEVNTALDQILLLKQKFYSEQLFKLKIKEKLTEVAKKNWKIERNLDGVNLGTDTRNTMYEITLEDVKYYANVDGVYEIAVDGSIGKSVGAYSQGAHKLFKHCYD